MAGNPPVIEGQTANILNLQNFQQDLDWDQCSTSLLKNCQKYSRFSWPIQNPASYQTKSIFLQIFDNFLLITLVG